MRFRIASSSDGCGLDCQVASGTRKRSKLGTLLDACAAGFSTYGDGRGRRSGQLSERGHLVPQWPKGSLMAAVHAMDPQTERSGSELIKSEARKLRRPEVRWRISNHVGSLGSVISESTAAISFFFKFLAAETNLCL